MKYEPIDELNLRDAVRHLDDARRMNNQQQIKIAVEQLSRQLDLVRVTSPDLYELYKDLVN